MSLTKTCLLLLLLICSIIILKLPSFLKVCKTSLNFLSLAIFPNLPEAGRSSVHQKIKVTLLKILVFLEAATILLPRPIDTNGMLTLHDKPLTVECCKCKHLTPQRETLPSISSLVIDA